MGQVGEKTFELRNYSLVKAAFQIDKIHDDGTDHSFSLSHTSGVI